MNADIVGFAFGMWFGATGPLVIHVMNSCLTGNRARIRLIVIPVAVVGILGVAATFGAHWTNTYTFGMLFGALIYALCVWLYLRKAQENGREQT